MVRQAIAYQAIIRFNSVECYHEIEIVIATHFMKTSNLAIEQHLFRSWPALTTRHYDGWVLRFADGYTRRSNSVNPVYGSSYDAREKIAHCEALYRANGQNIAFRLTDAVYPPALGEILADQGYNRSTPTSVQTLDLTHIDTRFDGNLHIEPRLTESWLADFTRINGTSERHLTTVKKILEIVYPPACFLTLHQNSETVAAGLGVCDGEYLGLFQIVTDGRYRHQGHGTILTDGLLRWGQSNGAKLAYLQVVPENTPATALYSKMGFHEAYQYWYWEKNLAPKLE